VDLTVISGGQSGADRAGLDAALACGLATGGWMPKGFLCEDGPCPEFATKYGLWEMDSPHYRDRTLANIREADATLVFAGHWTSPGTRLTADLAEESGKSFAFICLKEIEWTAETLSAWIASQGITTLNVAGNRESKCPGVYQFTFDLLVETFRLLKVVEVERGCVQRGGAPFF